MDDRACVTASKATRLDFLAVQEVQVRPINVMLASTRDHKRVRGAAPDGPNRFGPDARALRALVLGKGSRWTRSKNTFKLPIRIESPA